MILLDRYLLRSFLTPFMLCFFGFLGIWLVFDLQSNTSDFLDAHVSIKWVVYYYLTQVPQFMMVCIPVGLLLALLFCLSRMSRSNEIISMLTAGQSLNRLLLPLFATGLLLTGVCAFLNYSLAPQSESIRKELKNGISKKRDKYKYLDGQVFCNRADRRIWYVRRMLARAQDNDLLSGVTILQQNPDGAIVTKWIACAASFKSETKSWLLSNGILVRFAPDGAIQSNKSFQTLQIDDWSETPWRIASSNLDPQGLSVPNLRDYLRFNADFPPPSWLPTAPISNTAGRSPSNAWLSSSSPGRSPSSSPAGASSPASPEPSSSSPG